MQSRTTKEESTVYYLRSAEYVGECDAPFGPVHTHGFSSSALESEATPPPRRHTFIVFLDREFVVRARWDVDSTLARLGVAGSKLLLHDKELFDYAHPPASGSLEVNGSIYAVPHW